MASQIVVLIVTLFLSHGDPVTKAAQRPVFGSVSQSVAACEATAADIRAAGLGVKNPNDPTQYITDVQTKCVVVEEALHS